MGVLKPHYGQFDVSVPNMMLKLFLVLVGAVQLRLSAPTDPQPARVLCIKNDCFVIFWGQKQFSEARKVCEGSNGHLLMMRSVVEENVISLMQNQSASLWIELQLPQDCTKASQEPSGSRWVTDDENPDYVIWKLDIPICKNQCVTVSQDLSWEERQCDFMADGFLCEYNYPGTCTRLSAGASTAVTYTTPFKAQDSDLLALPPQTTASIPALGLELVCTEHSREGMRWSSGLPGAWHCKVENGGCEGMCHEKDGRFSCTCPDGWKLEADKRSCSTSCAGAPCEHLCNPHGADFTCMCHKGYKLAEDGISCQDIDDCQVNPDICDQVCINTEGGFQCQCHQGYELVEGKCKDVIYCHETRCQQKCETVPSGYRCSCFEGYIPDPHNHDKCVLHCNQNQCPANCDTHRQNVCYCPEGFVLDEGEGGEKTCVDIDECEMQHCDGICTNIPGSFRCDCPDGQVLTDPYTCKKGSDDENISGETKLYPQTAVPTHEPPEANSLYPGALIGITVGILSMFLILIAFICHLIKKPRATQRALREP